MPRPHHAATWWSSVQQRPKLFNCMWRNFTEICSPPMGDGISIACPRRGTPVAPLGCMTMDLKVLKCGNCEELKLGVHALALGVAALCGAYNAAAWLSRRERHLAVNTLMYAALI